MMHWRKSVWKDGR